MNRGQSIPYPLSYYELRALVFWAAVGIANSVGGSYSCAAESDGDQGIVNSIARQMKFQLPCKPIFKERP